MAYTQMILFPSTVVEVKSINKTCDLSILDRLIRVSDEKTFGGHQHSEPKKVLSKQETDCRHFFKEFEEVTYE